MWYGQKVRRLLEVDGGLLEYEASGVYLDRKRSLAVDRSYPNLN